MKDYTEKKWCGFQLKVRPEVGFSEFLEKCCGVAKGIEPEARQVPSSPQARVCWFFFRDRRYFYKEYLSRGGLDFIKNLFQGNRAIRSARGDLLLKKNGFQVPLCVLVGKKGGQVFKVSEAVDNGKELPLFCREQFSGHMDIEKVRRKRSICSLLGEEIGKMHAKNIIHGDLRWGNIVIEASGSVYKVWLIDNDRTKKYAFVSWKQKIGNLVQVNMVQNAQITATDRMRFFTAYLQQNPHLLPDKYSLARKVLKKTAFRIAQRTAKNRPCLSR